MIYTILKITQIYEVNMKRLTSGIPELKENSIL